MKQVLVRSGTVVVEDVPAPAVSPRSILVRVVRSCVSVGTELQSVRLSGMPLYRRALKQPQNVKRVLEVARDQGLVRTVQRVRGQLASGLPTGYSAAGVVIETGEDVVGFKVGDRVACAGAGIANHAEYINVPVNLAARIPDGVSPDQACTATLGAIALQGVRRARPTLGEFVGVIGLGIIGQLTVQILRANGCRTIGVDVDGTRTTTAVENGMSFGVDLARDSFVERVQRLTDGFGADAVIVTAATPSDEVIHEAMQACRKKGRVVLVGDVGLHLRRSDMYEKELDFLVSTSYGPGRYDPDYEDNGIDYPLPYVRWTENRNVGEYLRMLADGVVRLDRLPTRTFPVEQAAEAYTALSAAGPRPMIVILSYPERSERPARTIQVRTPQSRVGRIRVGLIGAGNFAEAMHVPNLAKAGPFELRAVASRTGADARAVAVRQGAAYATTDPSELFSDPEIDVVLITTRHDTHASLALEALRAGKHVFVEKPLAIDPADLAAIETFFADAEAAARPTPVLMTGFNRRFSPAFARVREALAGRTTPVMAVYRMNAGYLPPTHWVHGPEGGGRNIGEACHIYDLFDVLTGADVASIYAHAIGSDGGQWRRNDNFAATITYRDGSVCVLIYTALGHRDHPKERMEVFADGKVVTLDDYRAVSFAGSRTPAYRSVTSDKGHIEELRALASCLSIGTAWPIPLADQVLATKIAFEVEALLSK